MHTLAMHLVLLWALCMPILASAFTGITIIMSAPTQTNLAFVEEFKRELANSRNAAIKVRTIDLDESKRLVVAENGELVIALGVRALEMASQLKPTTLVLGVFTPLPVFNAVMEKSRRDLGNFSAIVLDQPYQRQMALVKTVLPESRSLGILLGSASVSNSEALREEGEKKGLRINMESITQESELIPKLNQILQSNDSLLAVPDPIVYSRETVQPILLTSYRYQKPVFGFSQSYVKAGALAAVYSTTAQLAKQAVEITVRSQQQQNILLPPQPPKYFSVSINQQVARALNITPDREEVVEKKLMSLEH